MATVPVYRTWVAGEIVTAAYMNSNVRDAGNFILAMPTAEMRQTVAQSIPNGGSVLTFDTEDIDNDNAHSLSVNTSRFVTVTAGRYLIGGGVGYAANTSGRKGCWWQINGSDVPGGAVLLPSTAANGGDYPARSRSPFLNAGDYLELYAYQESGAALLTSVGGRDQPHMSVHWISSS